MRLSRTCGYVLLALEYLARGDGPPVASRVISAAAGVSEGFLAKALRPWCGPACCWR